MEKEKAKEREREKATGVTLSLTKKIFILKNLAYQGKY